MKIKVLVTGAGALLGQGIIKALRASSLLTQIVAVDPSPLSPGLYWADSAYVVPMANSSHYLERFQEILQREKPDAVLIGTDVELPLFAACRAQIERDFGARVLVSEPRVVAIADDKWRTYEFFKQRGLGCPASCLPGDEEQLIEEVGFPLVVKPRIGARSIGVHIAYNRAELNACLKMAGEVIIQECVGDADNEYTAGALYFDNRCDASIVMRRDLRDGNTFRAFAGEYPELNKIVRCWAEMVKPYGPANFQFRLQDGCARLFEINARFSGTTPLRSYAGFNEVEMSLRHILFGERISQPEIKPIVILRHWEETVIEPQQLAQMSAKI